MRADTPMPTMLLTLDVDLHVVSKLLGHSKIEAKNCWHQKKSMPSNHLVVDKAFEID